MIIQNNLNKKIVIFYGYDESEPNGSIEIKPHEIIELDDTTKISINEA